MEIPIEFARVSIREEFAHGRKGNTNLEGTDASPSHTSPRGCEGGARKDVPLPARKGFPSRSGCESSKVKSRMVPLDEVPSLDMVCSGWLPSYYFISTHSRLELLQLEMSLRSQRGSSISSGSATHNNKQEEAISEEACLDSHGQAITVDLLLIVRVALLRSCGVVLITITFYFSLLQASIWTR
uniref:Uncharacterized protein n=1 Tax=Steinernema glaseri TaxID=37863 RepID=A0A1I7Z6Q8_9BILA